MTNVETKTFKGVIFTRVPCTGITRKFKWDGGDVGGIIFEQEVTNGFNYGWSGEWYETFEAAAEGSIAKYRHRYENAKRVTDAYEIQMKEIGDRLMWEPAT